MFRVSLGNLFFLKTISRSRFLMCFGRGWKGFDLGIGIGISNAWGHACS